MYERIYIKLSKMFHYLKVLCKKVLTRIFMKDILRTNIHQLLIEYLKEG